MILQPPVTEKLTRVLPGLVSWKIYDPSVRTDLFSHALNTTQGWWLIDPVFLSGESLDSIFDPQPVLGILLTNENHERNAFELSKKKGWAIHTHENTLGQLNVNPDFFFKDNEKLKGNIHVIHIPGATRGESCFYDPSQKICLVGDALINLKETGFTFLPEKYCWDALLAKKSLQILLDYDFEVMTFAHGEALTLNPKKKLQELLRGLQGA